MKEANNIYESNWKTLWWDAVPNEMKNSKALFKVFYVTEKDIQLGYQIIDINMIFNVKMGEISHRKYWMFGGGLILTPWHY